MVLARLAIAVAHPAPPSMWQVSDSNDRAGRKHRQERMDVTAAASRDCDIVTGDHHGFVNGIIMLPNSGQARAKLECEWEDCCLRARSCLAAPDSSAPQPPGVRGGSGPLSASTSSAYGSIPMTFGPAESRPLFSLDDRRPTTEHGCSSLRRLLSAYWIAASVAPRILFGFSTV